MNRYIFREYDIRGIVKDDLAPARVIEIGKAFGTYMRKKGFKKLSIARDGRLSSDRLRDNICEGLLSTGCDIIDVGMIPTPLLYYSINYLKTDGGVMITGSHNPPEFNGFKLCVGKGSLYGKEIQEICSIIEEDDFVSGAGKESSIDIVEPYIEMVKGRVSLERRLKVIIDGGNGMGGLVAPSLLRQMGVEVEEMFCNVDGNFPNHFPDPTVKKNLSSLIAKVKERRVDAGIAYDGDADRIGVIDDKGNIVWGDNLMILFSREILSRKPGAKIIFEVKCSQNLTKDIKKHKGEPIMWMTGHSLIKKKMRDEKAELAGEMSGHIFFSDNYLGYDDAIYATVRLLEILSKSDRTLSELLSDIPKTYSTPEIRIDCPDEKKFEIVKHLKTYFSERYDIIDIDGVRIIFNDGWGLVRASNTQPVIVLRFEAVSEDRLKDITALINDKLQEFGLSL